MRSTLSPTSLIQDIETTLIKINFNNLFLIEVKFKQKFNEKRSENLLHSNKFKNEFPNAPNENKKKIIITMYE